ncbi:unnamed protein product [Cylicostephanus goldi]|uniref:Uncharacterized protein n=1 Tax=Cylicostephanus goldi TaxID=71465 RepID=A0A3P7NLE6_CYLGO|nr:unnamed protein product [Cylicostephanus goldi]
MVHDITSTTAADPVSADTSYPLKEEKVDIAVSSCESPDKEDVEATGDETFLPSDLGTACEDKAEANVLPDVSLPPAVVQLDQIDNVVERQPDCSEADVLAFIENTMSREYDTKVIALADKVLLIAKIQKMIWLCRSLVVGMLAKNALLAEDLIDFNRLDLDLCSSEVCCLYHFSIP